MQLGDQKFIKGGSLVRKPKERPPNAPQGIPRGVSKIIHSKMGSSRLFSVSQMNLETMPNIFGKCRVCFRFSLFLNQNPSNKN